MLNNTPSFMLLKKLIRVISQPSKAYRFFCSRLLARRFAAVGKRFYLGWASELVGMRYVSIGANVRILNRARIEVRDSYLGQNFNPVLTIGNNVVINDDVHIGVFNRVEIHDDVLIASKVYISDHSHGTTEFADMQIPPSQRAIVSKGAVVIEECVWIGEGVAILPNVRIGRHSIIGANAVVTKDIPPFSIAAGVPAKVIRSVSSQG